MPRGVDGALQRVAPGQSLRELDWLLGSLVFWSQAGLDGAQLVRALQDTQAARLAPNPQSLPDRPVMAVLAGIDALEQRDFPRPSSGLARRWRLTAAVLLRAFPRPTQVATP